MKNQEDIFDVLIVGAGIAGVVAAWALNAKGRRVALVDPQPTTSPVFRAERISQQAAQTLKELGLFDRLERIAKPLKTTATIKGSRIEDVSSNTDYSTPLWQLVAELRKNLSSAGITVLVDRADSAETSPKVQTVQLHSGKSVQCRLLVVATGNAKPLLKSLGIQRDVISEKHSTTFGFDIECGEDFKLPTDSVSVRIYKDGADYLNIFPTPEGNYRGNLFTYWPTGGEQVRQFAKGDVNEILTELAPRMKEVTGDWRAVGKVQCGSMSVVKSKGAHGPGFVLIGDAYGRICPCLGNGIQKALEDVLSLRKYLPQWLETKATLEWKTISEYYQDPSRQALEDHLFKYSLFIRDRLINNQLGWQLRRFYYDRLPLVLRRCVRGLVGTLKSLKPQQTAQIRH